MFCNNCINWIGLPYLSIYPESYRSTSFCLFFIDSLVALSYLLNSALKLFISVSKKRYFSTDSSATIISFLLFFFYQLFNGGQTALNEFPFWSILQIIKCLILHETCFDFWIFQLNREKCQPGNSFS